ncbi:hypothetical protein [Sabulicella glaciei]|uniref:Uncharacterized protein n=1 Tax=Sabulicella glaciei TaxID=2984948 RepID=A0ABT3NRZ5_9PROT|nr:hypothetical protein [Roseococcus sp. MDT2-1-1]MCW8084933.1 hypothetical protein [Roseococcus sp. MDT2-1-1]
MILRPFGAPLGMMTLALVAKWAFALGLGLGAAAMAGACALRRGMGRGDHSASDPLHSEPAEDAVT